MYRTALPCANSKLSHAWPYICLLMTMIMFGSGAASAKFVLRELPHEVAAALRLGAAGVLLLVFTLVLGPRSKPIGAKAILTSMLAGLIGVFGYNLFFFWGISLAPSIDGGVIPPVLSPIITAIILLALGREKASRVRVFGLFLGLTGAAVFLLGANADTAIATRISGDQFLVLGACCWALYTIVVKGILARGNIDSLQLTSWATAGGGAALVVLAIPHFNQVAWASISSLAWYNLSYLIVGPTMAAYLLYNYALQQVGAATATAMMFTVPFFGYFFSTLLLGESLNGLQFGGAALLLAGALIAIILSPRLAGANR